MKKLILLFALFGFLTFTTACGGGDKTDGTETTDSAAVEEAPVEEAPVEEAPVEEAPVEVDSTVKEGAETPVEKVEE
jgi:hypothetical protein